MFFGKGCIYEHAHLVFAQYFFDPDRKHCPRFLGKVFFRQQTARHKIRALFFITCRIEYYNDRSL
jgi:hypothetical protein